ncbi:hypothetical protein M427DRAFT_67046 [Gonapodya prolifera JEL478]|uniref:SH3 domain-containing protein n=1 Tax=Gonapodya prolifera (strain JEL478) TaxID=1344416 RepID=A0A139ARI8_GONPJ|nr:hypothetical protein M427DRAFT_67046 [Gonapodya prolifera JEL478]|eukprot:KXS19371.1 hypothetical protein M427DRAFT_67046 [Gonapodya prolifera JEL478]
MKQRRMAQGPGSGMVRGIAVLLMVALLLAVPPPTVRAQLLPPILGDASSAASSTAASTIAAASSSSARASSSSSARSSSSSPSPTPSSSAPPEPSTTSDAPSTLPASSTTTDSSSSPTPSSSSSSSSTGSSASPTPSATAPPNNPPQPNLIFGLPVWAVGAIGGGIGGVLLLILCVLCMRKTGRKTRPKPADYYTSWDEPKRSRESPRSSPSSYAQPYESYDMPPSHHVSRQQTTRPDAVARGYTKGPQNRRQQNLQQPQGAYGGPPKSMAPYLLNAPQTVAMGDYNDGYNDGYHDQPPPMPMSMSPPPQQQAPATMVNVKGPPPSMAPGSLGGGPQAHWLFEKLATQQGKLAEQSVPYTGPPLEVHTAYEATASDEMSLFPGQSVELRDVFRDGWAVGWNRDTGGFGALPLDVLYLNIAAASLGVPQSHARTSNRMNRFVSQTLATQSSVLTERQKLRSGQSMFLRKGTSGSTLKVNEDSEEMLGSEKYSTYSAMAPLPGGTQVLRPAQSRRM